MDRLPIIDITGLDTADDARLRAIGAQIGAACREIGFFYVKGHAIDEATLADVFAMAHRFFELPEDEKGALAISAASKNRGYVHMRTEALDPGRNIDNKEAFNIGLELASEDPEVLADVASRALNMWPSLPGFRDTMLDYFARMHRLGCDLHRAIALDLDLDADHFEPLFDRPMATVRLLHYPPAEEIEGSQFGAGAHTDYGNLTILAVDEIGGLQVQRRDGTWIDATPIPGAFICNIGDCLMRWTNGVYASTPHRVVNPQGGERYSVAFFLDANPHALVDVLETCVSAERPKLYPPIKASDYLAERFAQTYGTFEKK